MSKINKKIVLPVVTLAAVLGTAFFGTQYASAQESSNPQNTLVQKIATRFNLNQDEVQKVFDEEHEARHLEMQEKAEERLTTLVAEGKITAEQKTLIINKQKELQAKRESEKENWQNLTPEERKTQMDAKKAEMEAWAKDNGIDINVLMFKGFMGKGDGHRPMR